MTRACLGFEFIPDASGGVAVNRVIKAVAKRTDPPMATYRGANLVSGGAAFLLLAARNTWIHNGLRRASRITTHLRMSLVRDAGERDRQDKALVWEGVRGGRLAEGSLGRGGALKIISC